MVGGARVLLLVVLLAAAAPGAAAASSNAASTHTYIVAAYAFGRASEGRMGVIRKAIQTRERALLRQCPRAAVGSPQNEESYKLSYEAAGALWAAGYGADASPIATFVRQTRGLHWTSAKTNRAFASFVDGLHGLSKLPNPSLCKDIATWKASGFTVVPATTMSFDKHVESLEAKPVASRLLVPYAQSADRTLLAQAQRIATKLLNFETQVGGDAWYALTEGLELNP